MPSIDFMHNQPWTILTLWIRMIMKSTVWSSFASQVVVQQFINMKSCFLVVYGLSLSSVEAKELSSAAVSQSNSTTTKAAQSWRVKASRHQVSHGPLAPWQRPSWDCMPGDKQSCWGLLSDLAFDSSVGTPAEVLSAVLIQSRLLKRHVVTPEGRDFHTTLLRKSYQHTTLFQTSAAALVLSAVRELFLLVVTLLLKQREPGQKSYLFTL